MKNSLQNATLSLEEWKELEKEIASCAFCERTALFHWLKKEQLEREADGRLSAALPNHAYTGLAVRTEGPERNRIISAIAENFLKNQDDSQTANDTWASAIDEVLTPLTKRFKEDWILLDKEQQTVKRIYFNPDGGRAGQYVMTRWNFIQILNGKERMETEPDSFFDYLDDVGKTTLADLSIGTPPSILFRAAEEEYLSAAKNQDKSKIRYNCSTYWDEAVWLDILKEMETICMKKEFQVGMSMSSVLHLKARNADEAKAVAGEMLQKALDEMNTDNPEWETLWTEEE